MIATEKHVAIAAKLYEARSQARNLLGEKFGPTMKTLGDALQVQATMEGKSVISVAMDVAQGCGPVATLYFLAAAVELLEPTLPPNAAGKAPAAVR